MKMSTQVNDGERVVSEVKGKSFLGAHIVLSDRDGRGEGDASCRVSVSGSDLNDENETLYPSWKDRELKSGDVVQVVIDPEGETCEPDRVRKTSEGEILDLSSEQADRVLESFQTSDAILDDFLREIQGELDPEVYKQIALAVGKRMTINLQSIKQPIYRKFPEKCPTELKKYGL